MATFLYSPPDDPNTRPLPWARWTSLVALLLVEAVFLPLLLRFNTQTNLGEGQWIGGLLDHLLELIFHKGGLVAVATFLVGGAWLREELQRRSEYLHKFHCVWPFFVSHVIALIGFVWLTTLLCKGHTWPWPYADGYIIVWAFTGLAALAFWSATVLPVTLWIILARRGLPALLAGTALGVVAWGAGRITEESWRPLSESTLWLVHRLLMLVCNDLVYYPGDLVVGTLSFAVRIEPACSGYEGIGLIWIFLGVYLWLFRKSLRFPQALVLLPIGTIVMWLANAVRIAVLVFIGTWWSPKIAIGGFHSYAGSMAFLVVGLSLVVTASRLRFFTAADQYVSMVKDSNPTAAYLGPLLALVATIMLTGVFSSGFDHFYPLRVLAVAGALWVFRREYARWRWTWSWLAVAIGVLVFALWTALEPTTWSNARENTPASRLTSLPDSWVALWLVFRVIGSVVMVPLAEELAFRGYLTRRLITAQFEDVPIGQFSWFSFFLSSVAFGALHHDRWLAGTLAGMLYALTLYRRGSIADAVLAHATTNALLAAYVLATGAWFLWG